MCDSVIAPQFNAGSLMLFRRKSPFIRVSVVNVIESTPMPEVTSK